MPNSSICVDASIVVQVLVNPANDTIQRQWDRRNDSGTRFVAPALLRYEVTNALHRYEHHGELSIARVADALDIFLTLPVEYAGESIDHRRALELAQRFRRPASHDTHYLALAERLGIEFWTADPRLANAVRPSLQWVHLVA